ncbi:histidine phosphatase family protein [Brevibacillus migulae]|uniref:histidine phosphatase family protein n=1 Tax=Brevibacillus migulae TaxID=1644114 RepID=UPI00106F05D8|nr:histidine phosphatase family protein [Brevibacillus migulae]
MKTIYLVRHCSAEGQAPDARLTEKGRAQAEQLADFFAGIDIEQIISSPFLRAMQSVEPLAARKGISIQSDPRLVERVLAEEDLPDWMERLEESFSDMELCLPGGESSRTAMERVIGIVHEILSSDISTSLIVTHGCLLTLLLKHFHPDFGFQDWQHLTNPDVFSLQIDGSQATVKRIWPSVP